MEESLPDSHDRALLKQSMLRDGYLMRLPTEFEDIWTGCAWPLCAGVGPVVPVLITTRTRLPATTYLAPSALGATPRAPQCLGREVGAAFSSSIGLMLSTSLGHAQRHHERGLRDKLLRRGARALIGFDDGGHRDKALAGTGENREEGRRWLLGSARPRVAFCPPPLAPRECQETSIYPLSTLCSFCSSVSVALRTEQRSSITSSSRVADKTRKAGENNHLRGPIPMGGSLDRPCPPAASLANCAFLGMGWTCLGLKLGRANKSCCRGG